MTNSRRNYRIVQLRANLGLTQAQLAERVTDVVRKTGPRWHNALLPGDYIARLEGGRITWPNATYRAALRTVLGVTTDAELGLYCQRVPAVRPEDDTVRRRDFLTTLPAAALTTTPLTELIATATTPAPAPHRVGLEHASQVRDLALGAGRLDHLYGGGMARDILATQVRWAVGLLDAHVDRAAEAEVTAAAGDLCVIAAWSAHDGGDDRTAQRYYLAALRCAERADDWDLRARALNGMARGAAYAGLGDDALTYAQHAQLRSDRLTPLRRASLALAEAHAHGQLGDARSALAAISRAEHEFGAANAADEPTWLATFFTRAEILGDSAHVLYDLARRGHHVDRAIDTLRNSVAAYPDNYPRSRSLSAARLATLLMHHGDPAEAATIGNTVLDTTQRLRSNRLTDTIRHLHRSAARHQGAAAVDAMRHRTTHTLTT